MGLQKRERTGHKHSSEHAVDDKVKSHCAGLGRRIVMTMMMMMHQIPMHGAHSIATASAAAHIRAEFSLTHSLLPAALPRFEADCRVITHPPGRALRLRPRPSEAGAVARGGDLGYGDVRMRAARTPAVTESIFRVIH